MRGTELWIEEYDKINTIDGERKASWIDYQTSMGNSDASIFTSVINKDVISLFDSLGLSYQGNGVSYTYKGTTPVTNLLFNVRYVLTDCPQYYGGYDISLYDGSVYNEYTQKTIEYGVYESDYVSGSGYVLDSGIENWNMSDGNPFDVQNGITRDVIGMKNVFDKVDLSDAEVSSFGCDILGCNDGEVTYKNTMEASGMFRAWVKYEFVAQKDMHMYICVQDELGAINDVYVDDEPVVDDSSYLSPSEIIDIGDVRKGQRITVKTKNDSVTGYTSTAKLYVYSYSDDVMKTCIDSISDGMYHIDEWKTCFVSGIVDAGSGGVLYTSIPYYKGFTAYVDGEKVDIVKIGGAMCGVELGAGEHEVVFRYFPYGLKTGIGLSLMGVLALFLCIKKERGKQ